MKNRMKIVADPKLQVILEKCLDADRAMELCLFEGSVSRLITEEIDAADIQEVQAALEKARKAAAEITKYISGLGVPLTQVTEYISGIEQALNTAQGELANISFAGGNPVAQAWGGKVTLPRIVKAVAVLYTKATDFTTGFTGMMTNIQTNLKPMFTSENDEAGWLHLKGTLMTHAGKNGVPTGEKLESGIKNAVTQALKGGYLTRIRNFFGKGKIGSVEKKIMSSIPSIDDSMIERIVDDIMRIPLSKLTPPPEGDPNPSDDIGNSSKEAEAELEQETSETEAENTEQGDPEDQAGEQADEQADESPVVSKQAFIDLLKRSPRMGQSKRGGKQQRLKFKQAVNKAAGKTVFEEGLLTGPRRIKADKVSDKDAEIFSRWKNLAGVID